MLEPAFRSLLCRIGHRLRVDGGAHDFPDYLQPKLKEVHDVLMHASTCKLDLDHIVGEERVIQCNYPSCNNGKILWRHIYLCHGINCLLCDAMLRLVLFHAGQCTDSNCIIPRCSDFKENIRRKERKARMNEKRLRMLRKKEQELKKIYDLQSIESQLAGAAACQLSLKEVQGSIRNQQGQSLLGSPSFHLHSFSGEAVKVIARR